MLYPEQRKVFIESMSDTKTNEAADNLIANPLHASYTNKTIEVAQGQLDKAGDNRQDIWTQVLRILSGRRGMANSDGD